MTYWRWCAVLYFTPALFFPLSHGQYSLAGLWKGFLSLIMTCLDVRLEKSTVLPANVDLLHFCCWYLLSLNVKTVAEQPGGCMVWVNTFVTLCSGWGCLLQVFGVRCKDTWESLFVAMNIWSESLTPQKIKGMQLISHVQRFLYCLKLVLKKIVFLYWYALMSICCIITNYCTFLIINLSNHAVWNQK